MAYRDINKLKKDSRLAVEHAFDLKAFNLSKVLGENAATAYDAPGGVDDIDSQDLKDRWNARIAHEYANNSDYHGRFFSLDSGAIEGGVDVDAVRWSADPAEPNFCFDQRTAQELSDWRLNAGHPIHSALSTRGRRETHNEYCEYRILFQRDANQRLRPKRVVLPRHRRRNG